MISQQAKQEISTRAENNTIIITFADINYLEVLLNWIISLHRIGIRNYFIISLDQEIHDFLTHRGFPSMLSPLDGDLSRLWIKRMSLFKELCDDGMNFIHSDADAVWLRNPLTEFFADAGSHIIASQGTTWPEDVLSKQGFVLCCGLFYLKACPENSALLEIMTDDIKQTGDDQVTLNRAITSLDVRWITDPPSSYTMQAQDTHVPYTRKFLRALNHAIASLGSRRAMERENIYAKEANRHKFVCYRKTVHGQADTTGLRISLLPHHLFQRVHMPDSEAYVKHLLSRKTSESKIAMLEETGCRFIKPGWRNMEFTENSISLIETD